jgi:predicted ATP-dependent protease
MTGEIDLLGNARVIGGVNRKLAGAAYAGATTVLLPVSNEKHVDDVSSETKDKLKIEYVTTVDKILEEALTRSPFVSQETAAELLEKDLAGMANGRFAGMPDAVRIPHQVPEEQQPMLNRQPAAPV